ncbi:MAG: peptidoglycan DD-metalloendopeptidase family protein [Glaciecola sp.]
MQKYQQRKPMAKHIALVCMCIGLVVVSSTGWAQSGTKELATIQSLIEQTQAQLKENMLDSERLQQELKLAELKIAETATLLNQTDTQLANTRGELANLNQKASRLETSIAQQQDALASQIKSAYMAGDYDFAKMIFNQEEAGKFERVLTYYQYLNKARQQEIENFRGLITALKTVKVSLNEQESALATLLTTQSAQSTRLRDQQQTRFDSLQKLEQQIRSDQQRVSQLQQQENDLLAAIEAAELAAKAAREDADKNIVLTGLSNLQGKLVVPVGGKIQRLFGKRRQGQVRWKGIVIDTRSGNSVKSVADGIVLYSDWLKGFGLVTIVDHGKGYMSVYGRNQALLKNVGDKVLAGEAISLAGTSGGQARASLYFEIRHKGKALNPSRWLARS